MELVGRREELAEVTARLRQRRLVTITGPGGVGKTRLASEAAAVVGPEFAYGAVTVDLTRIDRPEGVAEAIAGQLGCADFDSLINSPSDQPALLVFDNCEHVLDAAAGVATSLLAACEAPTILATSRSPLDLPAESIFTLGPLAVPPPDQDGEDDEDAVASVRLFLAQARDHGVAVGTGRAGRAGGTDRALVAEVCRRVDGVPLALEIAAARLRSITLAELISELDTRPHALSRHRFRGNPSHRSVADMVRWSTDLLAEPTRQVFERLAVFAGPFTASMAHAVTSRGSSPDGSREHLDELVATSLAVADTSGGTTWFRLLHPVRAVALDRLSQTGELDEIRSRLVDHVVELALDVIGGAAGGWDGPVLNDLLALYGNIAASLRWTLDHDAEPRRSLILLAVLWGVVHQSHTAEVADLGERVLARWPDPGTPGWPDAAATVATCRNQLGDPDGAIALAEATLVQAGPSRFAPATLRRVLARASRASGRPEAARDHFLAGARAAAEVGAHGLALELRVDHGFVVAESGDLDRGLAVIDQARSEAIERRAGVNSCWALACRANVLLRRGDAAVALPDITAALAEAQAIDYPAGISCSLRALAAAQLALGDLTSAAATLLDLLDELLQRGGLNDLRMVLDTAAEVLEHRGDPRWANLAVTAAAMPVTTVSVAVDRPVFARAAATGNLLSTRDAYSTCRRALLEIAIGPAGTADTGTANSPIEQAGPSLVRDGDVWRFTFDGSSVTVKVSKGVADLAALLARPGRELAALDLMGSLVAGGTRNEVVDATARRQYEGRIRDLQAEIDEAEASNDIGRAERHQAELDTLVDHLTASLGLGGRTRRTSDAAERARSAVTQRLRSTIRRLDELHPTLGAHLAASITTGAFCCYRPPAATTWTIIDGPGQRTWAVGQS